MQDVLFERTEFAREERVEALEVDAQHEAYPKPP